MEQKRGSNVKMETKQFKAESKRLLDLMINSIYTNKEIFLRELISNASDAMDKLYYQSLTDNNLNIFRNDLEIKLTTNKEARTLTIEDNGCGMNEDTEKLMQQILMEKHTLDLAGTGIGIQNVVTRLRMYYGEELSVVLESEPEKGTKFTFWLPIPENPEKDIE